MYRLREKQKSGAAKAILALTLLVNIGLLAFLKFGNYSLSLLGRIAALAGVSLTFEPLSLLMPIGISFYTLQAAGYIIDVYRRREIPEKNPAKFTLFMAFFPQILRDRSLDSASSPRSCMHHTASVMRRSAPACS